jgi:GAF domain-containing protein
VELPDSAPGSSEASDTDRADSEQASLEDPSLQQAVQLLEAAKRSLAKAGERANRHNDALLARIAGLENNVRETEEVLIRTERHAAQLGNLYVATYQLHASLDPADVRAAIADIAVNLLGAEQFVVLLNDETGRLVPSDEAETSSHAAYAGGDALIDAALAQLVPQFGPIPGSESVVAVPFATRGQTLGVLVVHAFLQHKPGLSADDRELMDLMAAHAASALLAARAFHVAQRKVSAYQGLLGFLRGGPG